MEFNRKIISYTISAIFTVILINLGTWAISQKDYYTGVIAILMGVVLLYFADYSIQIGINEKKIKEIEDWKEQKEELLKTLKEIVILKKISKL